MQKRETKMQRRITFSKRREGLFKKCAESKLWKYSSNNPEFLHRKVKTCTKYNLVFNKSQTITFKENTTLELGLTSSTNNLVHKNNSLHNILYMFVMSNQYIHLVCTVFLPSNPGRIGHFQ
ncbi:hypothetical protein K2173_021661 [Erythroxylum novogranatense]|uniref:MADS-box domain-containing protein n=1 Tax=Erythroxylum novogranatense TaxID=1862640 RepID=A0AAV8TJ52_9ROSI|nr:hypothetical protein K2173_021661 [Erythroxylum novogranatense]